MLTVCPDNSTNCFHDGLSVILAPCRARVRSMSRGCVVASQNGEGTDFGTENGK
jgi:hypothetical protein